MKLLHIADLHIGKHVNEFNMLEDQKHVLEQILQMSEIEKPDVLLIAGDVYDKNQPSVEAVELLDFFLTKLTALVPHVFMISGNHDSLERLSFGSKIMEKNGLYIARAFDGVLQKVTLEDQHGIVNIYMLPFMKPAMVKRFFQHQIESYDEALRAVISSTEIDTKERNILIAHQFVVNGTQQPERSESESLCVGGLDNVDASVFEAFDYVALGHLHRTQRIGRDTICYSGSPLKYSFSEARHQKSAILLDLSVKSELLIYQLPLIPLHDLREIKGPITELLSIGREGTEGSEDYIHVTLTDEEEIYDAIGQLRQVYPNLMVLDFENNRTRQAIFSQIVAYSDLARKSPTDLFAVFYKIQNNNELTPEQVHVMEQIFEQTGGPVI
ncbi:MAG: exonuclease SbcCD subunit D [Synergistaceae bacterium]|nr:exonuclease SbcCD subunit D [Synergistaceae bacterium]